MTGTEGYEAVLINIILSNNIMFETSDISAANPITRNFNFAMPIYTA